MLHGVAWSEHLLPETQHVVADGGLLGDLDRISGDLYDGRFLAFWIVWFGIVEKCGGHGSVPRSRVAKEGSEAEPSSAAARRTKARTGGCTGATIGWSMRTLVVVGLC
ncbi:hypothetical protein OROGR_000729 [Orobanche gracilis]